MTNIKLKITLWLLPVAVLIDMQVVNLLLPPSQFVGRISRISGPKVRCDWQEIWRRRSYEIEGDVPNESLNQRFVTSLSNKRRSRSHALVETV